MAKLEPSALGAGDTLPPADPGVAPGADYFLFAAPPPEAASAAGPQEAAVPSPGDDNILGDLYAGDVIAALAGDDVVRGQGGDDNIRGNDGDDTLYGDAGADRLYGGAGHDRLYGGAGADLLSGGVGDDLLDGGFSSSGGVEDIDVVDYSFATQALRASGWDDITGAEIGTDRLIQIEKIIAGSGDDLIFGREWHADGGAGNDTITFALYEGDGFVLDLDGQVEFQGRFFAVVGFENAIGNNYPETFLGTDGDNVFDGGGPGAEWDHFDGRGGSDTLSFASRDAVTYRLGQDAAHVISMENLLGSAFDDQLAGDGIANRVSGAAGNDELDGGFGDDMLVGGAGNDAIMGGGGFDTAVFAGDRAAYTVAGAPNQLLTITGPDGTDTLRGIDRLQFDDQVVDLVITPVFHAGLDVAETIYGGDAADRLYGRAGKDTIYGLEGNDDGNAGADADRAWLGLGDDRMYGFGGDDTLHGEDGADRLIGDAGVDRLFGGNDNDRLYGGSGDDTLDGGAGHDFIDGSGGHDFIIGGSGQDRLQGRGGNDIFAFSDGSGHDRIFDFEDDIDTLRIDAGDYGFGSTAAVVAASAVDGSDIVVTLDAFNTIRLIGFAIGHTTADLQDDIILV